MLLLRIANFIRPSISMFFVFTWFGAFWWTQFFVSDAVLWLLPFSLTRWVCLSLLLLHWIISKKQKKGLKKKKRLIRAFWFLVFIAKYASAKFALQVHYSSAATFGRHLVRAHRIISPHYVIVRRVSVLDIPKLDTVLFTLLPLDCVEEESVRSIDKPTTCKLAY